MTDMISLKIIKQLLQMSGWTAQIFGHRVKVYTDEAGWVDHLTFMVDFIFSPAVMTDAIIDEYADLIATYIVQPTEAREDAIEHFEGQHPTVVDAFYQREVAKGVCANLLGDPR
jgi:hypothetical protein